MPRVNFQGQNMDLPEQVNGTDLRRMLNLRPDERPVRVRNDGNYESINDNEQYFIPDEAKLDTVHELRNG